MTEYDMGYAAAVGDAVNIISGVAEKKLTAITPKDMAALMGMITNLNS